MWQRIQTVYLVVAIIACVVCMCLPVAAIVPAELGASDSLYNLLTIKADGGTDFTIYNVLASAFMLCACTDGTIAIFLYKKRKTQALLCVSALVAIVFWIALWGVYGYAGLADFTGEFKPSFAACLPVVALILFFLARKAILKDDALVRSMDRIR